MQTHIHHQPNKQRIWAILSSLVLSLIMGAPFLWMLMQPSPAQAASFIRVTSIGTTTWPCGTTWANACDLQTALANSVNGDELWIAQGVYKPSTTGDRAHTFTINKNTTLYGGFPASGDPTLADRDPTQYLTVLSGDLGGDDTTDASGVVLDWTNITGSDNSYHVLTMASPGSTILDGLVVTGGNADATSFPNSSGGGLHDNTSGSYTLRNMVFRGNRSYSGGGASFFSNNSGTVTMQDTSFIGNSGLQGGAMAVFNTTMNLTRVLFQENDAVVTGGSAGRTGGAMMVGGGSTPDNPAHPLTLTDVQFIANTAAGSNSAIYFQYGTAMLTNVLFQGNNDLGSWPNAFGSDYSALTLTNVVFSGNRGNGLRAQICHSTLTNVTASGNSNYGISLSSGTLDVRNSIIYGNTSGGFSLSSITPTISYSLVQGGCPGGATCTNVLSTNPLFVTPITAAAPTTTGDLRLQTFSPAIDAGDNTVTSPTLPATDLDGNARQLDDPATADTGNGSAPIVDMGAYEFAGPTLVTEIRQASDNSVITTAPIGTTIYGEATVYGIASGETPTGAVTLYLYDNTTCTGVPVATDTQTLVGGVAQSSDFAARTVYYQVAYTGDGNYGPMTSRCTLFLAYQPGPTFTVNTTADDSLDDMCSDIHCTLREAINAANDTVGDNTILFDVGDNQTLTLASALPDLSGLTGAIIIDGETHAPIISGNNAVRVFKANSDAQVTLAHLIISRGRDTSSECDTHSCGGGLKVEAGADVTLTHSMVQNSTAYYGGGIFSYGTLKIVNSTIANNVADFWDGGIYSSGSLTIENSTISGNTATSGNAGGLASVGALTMKNSTIFGNTAAGDTGGFRQQSSAASIYNTLIANNSGADCSLADGGSLAANVHNLVEDGTCSPYLTGNPQLGPLADNGGETLTHALLPNSPAIDAGEAASCLPTDQRGLARDDLGCDLGAFEVRYADTDTVMKENFLGSAPYTFGPTWIRVTLNAADSGTLTVTKHLTYPGGSSNPGEFPATWHLNSTLTTGFPVTLAFCYTDAEVVGLTETALRAFRWNGTTWVQQGDTAPVNRCVTVAGVTAFSAWTLFDTSVGATPTAVTLTTFSARTPTRFVGWLVGLVAVGIIPIALHRRKKMSL